MEYLLFLPKNNTINDNSIAIIVIDYHNALLYNLYCKSLFAVFLFCIAVKLLRKVKTTKI